MDRSERVPAQPADRFSVCEHVLRLGDIRRDIAAAVAAGVSGFSVNASDLGGVPVGEAAAAVGDAGLTVTSYVDPTVMCLGPRQPDLDAVRRAADDAAAFGAPAILLIAGPLGGRSVADADVQLVDALAAIAERIAGTGVRPMVEPLHPMARDLSYVHTVRHALDLAMAVDDVGVVVDTGASWWERDLVEALAGHLDRLVAVQITDVRADEIPRRHYVREACCVESEVPVATIVRDLVDVGYGGWFEHEVLAPFDAERRTAVVSDDRRWFATIWDQ